MLIVDRVLVFRQYMPRYLPMKPMTFAHWRECRVLSPMISRNFAHWQESRVLSPKNCRTFAIGEWPLGESHIGEIRKPHRMHPPSILFCDPSHCSNRHRKAPEEFRRFFSFLISQSITNPICKRRSYHRPYLLIGVT